MPPNDEPSEEKRPSILKRFTKLPDSRPHMLLTLIILIIVVFLLIKMAS